jgi:hypothetical protein
MANRQVIYEAAFEDYLRSAGIPYVAVDEAKKALFAGVRLKSFDFVVYSNGGPNLLVDVKGRRFPRRRPRARRHLENWATEEDLQSLAQWEGVFGTGFTGVVVFCYHLEAAEDARRFEAVHLFRGEYFGLLAVYRDAYARACRPRSKAWGTVSVPAAAFRQMVRPVTALL